MVPEKAVEKLVNLPAEHAEAVGAIVERHEEVEAHNAVLAKEVEQLRGKLAAALHRIWLLEMSEE
jgi:hypothetical protein